jgi:hypothetical protein
MSADDINKAMKKLLREPQEICNKTGLKPFYALNQAPPVSVLVIILSGLSIHNLSLLVDLV